MELLKQFLQTKEARRWMWTFLNVLMAGVVSYLAFMASNSAGWALALLPFATAFSQTLTKYLNE